MRTWWRLSTGDAAAGGAVALVLLLGAPGTGLAVEEPTVLPPLAPQLKRSLGEAAVAAAQGQRPVVLWAAAAVATRAARGAEGVSLPWLEPGALLGLLHVPLGARDARGDEVPSGYYTLRYAVQPRLKDHVEVSPHRDFALLVPIARDRGGPLVEAEAMARSRPAAGRHPHVLALSADEPCPPGGVALRLGARGACLLLSE